MKKFRFLTAAVCGLLAFLLVAAAGTKTADAEEEIIADTIRDYVERVLNGEEESVYNESFSVQMHLNTMENYTAALHALYDNVEDIQYRPISQSQDVRIFSLYSGGKYLADFRQQKQADGSWAGATIFPDQNDYILEVPAGMNVSANGSSLGSQYLLESNVTASSYKGMTNQASAPKVDRYKINGLLGLPAVKSGEEKLAVIEDVTDNILYIGTDVTADEELKKILIQYALTCARFPTRDGGLGAVANISVTDSQWYSRVSGVQNDWFTAHNVAQFSNEDVLKAVRLNDNAVIANVVFDYYASNGVVSRTWNCGYQMSLVKIGGVWKIGGMGINSTMNPRSDKIK